MCSVILPFCSNFLVKCQLYFYQYKSDGSQIRIGTIFGSWIRIRIRVKTGSGPKSAFEPNSGALKAQNGAMDSGHSLKIVI
jgi:hypothetical protein